MENDKAFFILWSQMPSQSLLTDFFSNELDEEDFVLAEAMVGEGLNRLMEFKTQLLNAKHKLQAPDLQRGVLPQTEEGKEGVCAETLSDKTKAAYLHQAINGNTAFRRTPAKDLLPSQATTTTTVEESRVKADKSHIRETKGATFRLQGFEEGFFGAIPNLRCEDIRMPSGSNGNSPHEGSGE